MPESKIPKYSRALWDDKLARWPDGPSLFQLVKLDASACSFTVHSFLDMQARVDVRSEPDLRGPVFRGHLDQGDVDDIGKGVRRVIKVCI
jgi:hypothetical protein